MGRDSSVGIATHYWLDEIESRSDRGFPYPPPTDPMGLTLPPAQWILDLFPRAFSSRGVASTTDSQSRVEVSELVQLLTAFEM